MELNDIKQGTDLWLEHRRRGIGSSDSPVIMGVSPWKDPHTLWLEKTNRQAPPEMNWAMRRGHELEPVARARYELETGMEMPAILAVHKDWPFLKASLDGYNAEKNIALEIKCPGKKDHLVAQGGFVPEKYKPQLQHLLLVTGAERIDYYSYREDSDPVLIPVEPDRTYIQTLMAKEFAFWGQVVADIWLG